MKQSFVFVVVLAASLVRPSGRAAAETPTEKRLRLLEEKLRQAEEEIRELKGQVQQQKAIGQATQKQVEQTAEEAKTAAAEAKKGVELPDWTKRTTIFGDVRTRHEGFYHQPHTKTQVVTARNRERLRARLGVRVAFSDEVSATIRGASGDPNNPISPNEDLGGNFTRKHFNLDWAYLTFAPGASFGIRPGAASITLGKFPNPIFRVGEMVFDEDLSPEGASETFQLLDKPMGALDQVKVHGLQWTFTEISNNEDGWMFGGQVNPTLHFGNVQLEGGVGQFWWLNSDLIAQAPREHKRDVGQRANAAKAQVTAAFEEKKSHLAAAAPAEVSEDVTEPGARPVPARKGASCSSATARRRPSARSGTSTVRGAACR